MEHSPLIYDFSIDAWTPHTLPMARLAAYLSKLSPLFGNTEHVHFIKVRKGSAVQEIHVDQVGAHHVFKRLTLVGQNEGPSEAEKALPQLNAMLREDNASATLRVKDGAKIIFFPGRKTVLAEEVIIHESGELTGCVIRLGGKDESVPLLLQTTEGELHHCTTNRAIAKELAHHLFGDVLRVSGAGKWKRTVERRWELLDFKIKSWEPLEQTTLADAVSSLRAVEGSHWNQVKNPYQLLAEIRKG